jgi:hypothetical protein
VCRQLALSLMKFGVWWTCGVDLGGFISFFMWLFDLVGVILHGSDGGEVRNAERREKM